MLWLCTDDNEAAHWQPVVAWIELRSKAAKIMQPSFIVLITHIYPSCVATTALAAPRFAALRSTHELSSA